MLTFEKVLKVFQAYLDDDPLYEVVQTSHGYTLMAWEPHRNDWYSAEIQKTPENLRNALLGTYANFLEDKITGNDRDLTATETEEIQQRCRELLEKCLIFFKNRNYNRREMKKSKRKISKVKSFWVTQLYIKCKAFYTWKAVTRYRRFHTN